MNTRPSVALNGLLVRTAPLAVELEVEVPELLLLVPVAAPDDDEEEEEELAPRASRHVAFAPRASRCSTSVSANPTRCSVLADTLPVSVASSATKRASAARATASGLELSCAKWRRQEC